VRKGRDAWAEEEAVLRVAEAALDPGLPERGGDEDEIGHWGRRYAAGLTAVPALAAPSAPRTIGQLGRSLSVS